MKRFVPQVILGLIMVLYPTRSEGGDVKISATPVVRIEWRLIKDEKAEIPEAIKADVQAIREHLKTFDLSQWLQQHFFPEKDSQYAHFNPDSGYKEYHLFLPNAHTSRGFYHKSPNGDLRCYQKVHKFLGCYTPYYYFTGKNSWKIEGATFSGLVYPFEVGKYFVFVWKKSGEDDKDPYKQTDNLVVIDRDSGRVIIDKPMDFWSGWNWFFPVEAGIGLPFYKNGRIYFQSQDASLKNVKKPIEDRLSDIVVLVFPQI